MSHRCEFFSSWFSPGWSGLRADRACDAPAVADIPYADRRKWFCAEHFDIVAAHYRSMYREYGSTWPALAEVANL